MENRRSAGGIDSAVGSHALPWGRLEERAPSAFTLAGALLLGSVVAPVGLKPLTDWAWASGLVLVGAAVLAAAAGLLGLCPAVADRAPRLATAGIMSALVAAAGALGLVAMGGLALVAAGALGTPMDLFVVVALATAGGFALGFLSFGAAGLRSGGVPPLAAGLLLLGGVVLLVPIAGEVLRRGFGIGIGIPPWAFLPALAVVTLDAPAIGHSLRAER